LPSHWWPRNPQVRKASLGGSIPAAYGTLRVHLVQHPDGLYYGPPFPGEDDQLVWLEERGMVGHSSVRRGEYRYFLRHPDRT
jgi:hypothetical protein